jgi:hypothetical protein
MSLVRGDGAFERLTRIEQRLERSIHRNMEELRKLRKRNDEVSSLQPSLRPCPFLSQSASEFDAQPEPEPQIPAIAVTAETIVRNEPKPAPHDKRMNLPFPRKNFPARAPLPDCQPPENRRAIDSEGLETTG